MARAKQTALIVVLLVVAVFVAMFARGTPSPAADPTSTTQESTAEAAAEVTHVPSSDPPQVAQATRSEVSQLGWRVCVIALIDAAPLAGAAVEVHVGAAWQQAANDGAPLFSGVTDSSGRCVVPAVGDPWLVVRASKAGFVPAELTVAAPRPGEQVVLGLAAESRGQVLVLSAETRRPVPGAHVYLRAASFAPVTTRYKQPAPVVTDRLDRAAAVTDADGIALIRGFAPGLYDLAVVAPGMLAADLRAVELPFAPSPLGVELQPGCEIDALVVDEQQQAKVGWEVQFRQGGRTWIAVTDERGHATSPGFAPESVVTAFVPREDLDLAARFAEAMTRPTRVEVTLPAPQTVRLVVSAGHANPFKVVWPPGAEGDSIEIEVLQEIPPSGYGLSQRITVPAAAGEVEVGASATGTRGRFVVQGQGKTSGLWRSEPFFVSGPGQIVPLREVTYRSGVLQGRVLDEEGAPVPGAVVGLSAVPASLGCIEATFEPAAFVTLQREEPVAADGSFVCDLLLPGRYLVAARAPGGGAAAAVVQVGDASTIDLVLAEAGSIRGVVRNCPPNDAPVVVVTCSERSWRAQLPVDPRGDFTVTGLVAGLYSVALQRLPGGGRQNPFARPVASGEVVVEVNRGAASECVLDALTVQRSLRVEVAQAPSESPCDVQIERLHPFDRTGAQVWRMRRPLPRSGFVSFDDLDPEADYVVSARRTVDGRVLAWAQASRRERVLILRPAPGVDLNVSGVAENDRLALVPVGAAGALARDCLIRPASRAADRCTFTALAPGEYRLIAAGSGDYCGIVTASMPVTIGAAEVVLRWAPGR